MDLKDWANLQKKLTATRDNLLKGYQGIMVEDQSYPSCSISRIGIAIEILSRAGQPLHVDDLIERAAVEYHLCLNRESLVASLSKKVKKGRIIRVAPNTFTMNHEERCLDSD